MCLYVLLLVAEVIQIQFWKTLYKFLPINTRGSFMELIEKKQLNQNKLLVFENIKIHNFSLNRSIFTERFAARILRKWNFLNMKPCRNYIHTNLTFLTTDVSR